MKGFFERNKTFVAIIVAGLIVGGFIYLSNRPTEQPTTTQEPTSPTPPSRCVDFREAEKYIGEYKCITGRVDHVYTSAKRNTFLNFCPDYRTCAFSSTIFAPDAYKFPNPKQYEGKAVDITGLVSTYRGRAQIILNDPNQIKVR